MTFHESTAFKDAIEAAAEALSMRAVLVEKDYWVTYILRQLAHSIYVDRVVFKGGTSLSKAYDCIKRFSEDIDLALIPEPDMSGNQVKNLLSEIDHAITEGLTYVEGEKRGRNRTTTYQYPKSLDTQDFGAVRDYIKVELNAFTHPIPFQRRPIASYLYRFLLDRGNIELIRQYQLQSFEINVLSLERTFFEKLLAINRLSYDGIERLRGKIRHFYDLHALYHHPGLTTSIFSASSFNVLLLVKQDDERIETFTGPWKGQPLAQSPLFIALADTWKQLTPQYIAELGDLIWQGVLPEPNEILNVLLKAKEFLENYDGQTTV